MKFVSNKDWFLEKINPLRVKKLSGTELKTGSISSNQVPLESAMIIGADIPTDKPLRDTIQFLSNTVDQIIAYSAEL